MQMIQVVESRYLTAALRHERMKEFPLVERTNTSDKLTMGH